MRFPANSQVAARRAIELAPLATPVALHNRPAGRAERRRSPKTEREEQAARTPPLEERRGSKPRRRSPNARAQGAGSSVAGDRNAKLDEPAGGREAPRTRCRIGCRKSQQAERRAHGGTQKTRPPRSTSAPSPGERKRCRSPKAERERCVLHVRKPSESRKDAVAGVREWQWVRRSSERENDTDRRRVSEDVRGARDSPAARTRVLRYAPSRAQGSDRMPETYASVNRQSRITSDEGPAVRRTAGPDAAPGHRR